MVPRMLESSGNVQKCVEVCEVVQRVGNRVTEFGFEYFCLAYVSKIGVSVMQCNSIPPSRTSSQGPIEICGEVWAGIELWALLI